MAYHCKNSSTVLENKMNCRNLLSPYNMQNTWLYYSSATITISIILLLPGCGLRPRKKVLTRKITIQPQQSSSSASCSSQPMITVWIHGTRIFPPSIFHIAFQGKPGLKHFDELRHSARLNNIIQSLITADPQYYTAEDFFLFGWSGKLSFSVREQASQVLYDELDHLVQLYQQEHQSKPSIRIIAHSHGGNVALNLAKVKKQPSSFYIDELVLLACPVQGSTMHLVSDPLFKKIYSLYSTLDIVQVLDPQGLYHGESNGLFSHRLFPHNTKLAQVKVKCNGRALMHTEFITPGFLQYVPRIIAEIEQWKCEHLNYHDKWSQMNKLLCLYTDGRAVNCAKYTARNLEFMQCA